MYDENEVEQTFSPEAQTHDEDAAWIDGQLFRQDLGGDRYHCLIVGNAGLVVADFVAESVEGELDITHANFLATLKGEKANASQWRKDGFSRAKAVRYNTLTDEIEVI